MQPLTPAGYAIGVFRPLGSTLVILPLFLDHLRRWQRVLNNLPRGGSARSSTCAGSSRRKRKTLRNWRTPEPFIQRRATLTGNCRSSSRRLKTRQEALFASPHTSVLAIIVCVPFTPASAPHSTVCPYGVSTTFREWRAGLMKTAEAG